MRKFRIKHIRHNNFYAIQKRTGLFSWRIKSITLHEEKAIEIKKKLIIESKKSHHTDSILIFSLNSGLFCFFPSLILKEQTIGIFWLNIEISIKL